MSIYHVWYANDGIAYRLIILAQDALDAAQQFHRVVNNRDDVKVMAESDIHTVTRFKRADLERVKRK